MTNNQTRRAWLTFTRHEAGEYGVTSVGFIELETSLPSQDVIVDALTSATTAWVNKTAAGREAWEESCKDLNIGDLELHGAFSDTSFITELAQRGITKAKCQVFECADALAYDTVLVNSGDLTDQPVERS